MKWLPFVLAVSAASCRCSDPRPAPVDYAPEAAAWASSSPLPSAPPPRAIWEEITDLNSVLGGWGLKDQPPWLVIQSQDSLGPRQRWTSPYYYLLRTYKGEAWELSHDCGMTKKNPQVGHCLKGGKRVATKVIVSKSTGWISVRIGDEEEILIRHVDPRDP